MNNERENLLNRLLDCLYPTSPQGFADFTGVNVNEAFDIYYNIAKEIKSVDVLPERDSKTIEMFLS